MEKVFCENCKYHYEDWPSDEEYKEAKVDHYCELTKRIDCFDSPISRECITCYDNCEEKNEKNNCPNFVEKKRGWFCR